MSTAEPVSGDRMELFESLKQRIERRESDGLPDLLERFHPSDIADLMEELEEADRLFLLGLLPAEIASETLAEMESEEHPEELLAALDPSRLSELLAELADDDAADLIGELSPEDQSRILALLPRLEARDLRALLQYDEESAGGIMTTELVAVPVHLSTAAAIAEVRRQAHELSDEFYTIFVVDRLHRLLGTVSLHDLVLSSPERPLAEIVQPPTATVPIDMDQEDVGRIISRYNLPSVPVVGPDNVLLGRITFDDVIDVMEAEQTEDMLRLAGVVSEEDLRGGWAQAVRSRLPWLMLNLITAGLGASVVYFFRATIEEAVILASAMPVVAALGGNGGTQALAVTVRRLALTSEAVDRRLGVAAKELLVGMVNGAALGVVLGAAVGVFSWAWIGEWQLGLVVLLAMWGNQVVAAFAGSSIPILLERIGVDPAVASSIFVTALTDMAGFFLLLGLATALML